jgi:nucleotide-binding universal stress UspA family protein
VIVLIAIDFSAVTLRQLAAVTRLVRNRPAVVYLLHVAQPDPAFVGFEAGPAVVRDQVAAEFHREHRDLQRLAGELREMCPDTTALLVQGPTVETILGEAGKLGADLVVVGSHGHGAAYDLLVGSVSAGVIRKSSVPVLVVPARGE